MMGSPNRDISSDPIVEKYQEVRYRAAKLEAERDQLRERERELVEALAQLHDAYGKDSKARAAALVKARVYLKMWIESGGAPDHAKAQYDREKAQVWELARLALETDLPQTQQRGPFAKTATYEVAQPAGANPASTHPK